MRRLIFILVCLILAGAGVAEAARLKGLVMLQNSNGQPIQGVQISADGANPAVSYSSGKFELIFAGKKPGDHVVLVVKKKDMEVVNRKELNRELPAKPDEHLFKIILCKEGDRDRHATQYYEIAKLNILENYDKALQTIQGNQQKIAELTAQKDAALAKARELAEQFAGKNLDNAGELYKKAFEHFKKGEIDKAIEVLEDSKIEEIKQKALKQCADNYWLKAELYITQLQFDKAEEYYQKAVQTAPEDFWNNGLFADFLKKQTKYKKALPYYKKALQIAKTPENKAGVLNDMGILYKDNNRFEEALLAYNEALTIRKKLALKNPNAFLQDVAMTQNNLGLLHADNNRVEEALNAYTEALNIYKQLALKNPNAFLQYVATTQNNLGILLKNNNRVEEALNAYNEALNIRKKLALKNPDAFLQDVAMTQNNLGNLYSKNNRVEEALNAYNEALSIYKKLALKNPNAFLQYVAATQNNLGLLHADNNRVEEALNAYNEALTIYKKLTQKNPNAFLQYVATTQNNLGNLYSKNNRVEEALNAYNEALNIRKKLALKNPDAFLQDVATTQNNLGILYATQQQFDKAKEALEEALNIRQELRQRNPRAFDIDFCGTSYVLAWSYINLAAKDGNPAHLKKAQSLLDKSIPILQKYPDLPKAQKHLRTVLEIKKIIEKVSKETN